MSLFYETTDSEPVTATVSLEGVWLHDPADPVGTSLNLRYGSAMRSSTLAVDTQHSYYAGRAFPAIDFGAHESDSARVAARVPNGPGWYATLGKLQALIRLRRVLIFRDNRGRNMPGVLSGYTEIDQPWGTEVAFTVTRVDTPYLTSGDVL